MSHDKLCATLEQNGVVIAYVGEIGGSDHINCLTCDVIHTVRDDEQRRVVSEFMSNHGDTEVIDVTLKKILANIENQKSKHKPQGWNDALNKVIDSIKKLEEGL
jgi:hypothetical protein